MDKWLLSSILLLTVSGMSIGTASCTNQAQDAAVLGGESPATRSELDQRIQMREERNLKGIQSAVMHKNKPLNQQIDLAKVGKSNFSEFQDYLKQQGPVPATSTEAMGSLFKEYKRIWLLADEAYSALRSDKFKPELKLIPYLTTQVSGGDIAMLLFAFNAELKREGMDPRALGAECSEMLKLRAIVDTLTDRL